MGLLHQPWYLGLHLPTLQIIQLVSEVESIVDTKLLITVTK